MDKPLEAETRYIEAKKILIKKKEADLRKQLVKLRATATFHHLLGDSAVMQDGILQDIVDAEELAEENEQKALDIEDQLETLTEEYQRYVTNSNNLLSDPSNSSVPAETSSSAALEIGLARPEGGGVTHPVDAYLLMKRMSVDWAKVNKKLQHLRDDSNSKNIANNGIFPRLLEMQ